MASSIRFLQCAGFRFDSPSWDGPAGWTVLRNQDLWQTFQSVLSLCRSEKIEFLFLTGDLFEQEYVRKETVERVAASLAKLEGTRIFITPGSRDPLIMSSAYRLAVWPSNVHIFSSGVSSVKIPSHNLTVFGAGWPTYHQEGPFLSDFQTTEDGTLQLMVLHAEVDTENNTEGFIPILQEQIASSGLTYLALGHRESWSGVQKAGETFWADSGSPEARSFRESGSHGIILGEIEKESARFEFRELGQRHYIEKTLAFQSNIEALVAKLLLETSSQERQTDLFRIKLTGPFQDVEETVLTLQNRLMDEFRYIEVIPCNTESISQRGPDVVRRENSTETQGDGYPTLTELFFDRILERKSTVKNDANYEHWELVKIIGMTALGQGRTINEN